MTLSEEMVRLAEDDAMFKIARFEKKNSGTIWAYSEQSSEFLCKSTGIDNPNSETQLTGRSEQLVFLADNLLG
jgi:hypothetical protein